MTWHLVDDQFADHPKVERLEVMGVDAHAHAIAAWTLLACDCRSRGTAGLVTRARVEKVLWAGPRARRNAAVEALVQVGLWEQVDAESWQFHDWDDYDFSAAAGAGTPTPSARKGPKTTAERSAAYRARRKSRDASRDLRDGERDAGRDAGRDEPSRLARDVSAEDHVVPEPSPDAESGARVTPSRDAGRDTSRDGRVTPRDGAGIAERVWWDVLAARGGKPVHRAGDAQHFRTAVDAGQQMRGQEPLDQWLRAHLERWLETRRAAPAPRWWAESLADDAAKGAARGGFARPSPASDFRPIAVDDLFGSGNGNG